MGDDIVDDDIVERLRFLVDDGWYPATHTEAADEIERLRVELNAWRRATKGAERLLDRARCEAKKERAEIERLRVEVAKRQALIDAWAAAHRAGEIFSMAKAGNALLAAATPKEDDRG